MVAMANNIGKERQGEANWETKLESYWIEYIISVSVKPHGTHPAVNALVFIPKPMH